MRRNQRLSATLTIGSVLERSVGRNLNVVRRGLDNVNSEIAELTSRRRDMERQRRELERQGRSVEDLDREYSDLGRTLEDLRRRQERYERAAASARRVGDTFRTAAGEVGRLGRNVALGVGTVGGAMVALARDQATAIEEITRASNRIGVDAEWLSGLGYAARQFGVENDALVDGLKELSMRADEFAETGGGPAAEAFGRLGISAEEAGRLASDTEEMFAVVRDRIAEIDDVAARQRIADEVFGGTAGEVMIEVLQLTREELDAMIAEASRAGAVITQEQTAIARAFDRSWNRVGAVIDGVMRSISVELMPALGDAFDRLSEHLIENRENIVELAGRFGDWLGETIPKVGDLVAGVGDIVGAIGRGIDRVAQMVGGFQNLGKIIGAVIAGRAVLAVGSLIFEIGRFALAVKGAVAGIGGIGTAINAAAAATAIASRSMIGSLGGVRTAALGVAGVMGGLLLSRVPDDPGEWAAWQENNVRSADTGLRSLPGVGAAMRGYESAYRWWHGEDAPDATEGGFTPWRPQQTGPVPRSEMRARAVGGAFPAGAVLVGERGPELRYESRSGFIAHHAALQRLAEYARDAAGGLTRAVAPSAERQPVAVTIHAPINAAGMDPRRIRDELQRLANEAASGALYDHAGGYGQYG
ncbi:hypothetical protein [Roseicyclus amphidinii]|uniref:hypothetical protein n=1 Tax=Roseicyclus amphidinii TaxID=3034232 RepID=UPI0024E0AF3F|nr:hypothetical protein [Roseicyclus sp. Amp-Y-6]